MSLLSILSLLLLTSAVAGAGAASITLPLSPLSALNHADPFQNLKFLATLSTTRARHLKRPGKNSTFSPSSSGNTDIPLLPQSYGGYSVSLSFGTPPQKFDLVMDTGSSLVWFPCTSRYTCSRCNFPNVDPENITAFMPKLSSTAKVIGCKNPKCGLIYGSDSLSTCRNCVGNNCTEICPPYMVQYGSGSTSGLLLSETLDLPGKLVEGVLVGCSIISTQQPSGIAGFGRGPESLPVQMGLKKFSYCLVSHNFDDTGHGSEMVLVSGSGKTRDVSYTPFVNNTMAYSLNPAFSNYYYVGLRKITVGGRKVRIPYRFLAPGADGSGGTIIDSGTTFTFMERDVHGLVAAAFEKEMGKYKRVSEVEDRSGLRPCFDVSNETTVSFPELVFHFKGGAKMEFPLADYFSLVDGNGVICMTIVTDDVVKVVGGPSIILGNYQQQNFYVEYDLENQRLGFRKKTC
ncbi:probable aspartyl protease At4g16563 [Impatiens glandulifera]|uniref:probable aspartyl protease At4g16563 n=1 Tax=Impatiens glandulifera TaxID=253017 RepID=UPI001FB1119E|nr:probable aspartyl protease At4g16563 [Impatiens glandulifera]